MIYPGSSQLRQGPPRKPRLSSQPRKRRLSSRGAAFLMILPPSKLTKVQQQQLEQITHHEELRTVYLLSQEFVTLLKEQQVEALTPGSSEPCDGTG